MLTRNEVPQFGHPGDRAPDRMRPNSGSIIYRLAPGGGARREDRDRRHPPRCPRLLAAGGRAHRADAAAAGRGAGRPGDRGRRLRGDVDRLGDARARAGGSDRRARGPYVRFGAERSKRWFREHLLAAVRRPGGAVRRRGVAGDLRGSRSFDGRDRRLGAGARPRRVVSARRAPQGGDERRAGAAVALLRAGVRSRRCPRAVRGARRRWGGRPLRLAGVSRRRADP